MHTQIIYDQNSHTFLGGCACGAIRYESTAEPVMMLHCHCRDCQQSSGGPFSSFVIVPKEAFKLLHGAPRFHASPSHAGGKTHRGFCHDCGSPIFGMPDSVSHIVAIRAASLDDPSWFKPQVDVWTSDAHPWDQMNPASSLKSILHMRRLNNKTEKNIMPKIKTVRGIENRKVVPQKEWLAARTKLLVKEKKFSKLRDELNLQRRKLPWVKVETEYDFTGPTGQVTLADLFCGKSQLVIYHFMFGPGWKEGCEHCSFWADHFDCVNLHIGQRDTAFAVVSRAPRAEIEPFKRRMGWRFNWVSSFKTNFSFDFNVSFTPEQIKIGMLPYNYGRLKMKIDELQGVSAFYRDKNGDIYHTYSSYARGIDLMNNTYNFLDLTAKGRDEKPGAAQDWVRYHDEYKAASKDGCCL